MHNDTEKQPTEAAESSRRERPRPPRQHGRYLPVLTWILLAAILAYVVRQHVLLRPTDADEKGTAAVQRAVAVIRENFYKEVEDERLYRAALRGIVEEIDDPFTVYLQPREYRNAQYETQGEFGGIGVVVRPQDQWTVIVKVQDTGPAADAGVSAGDVILEVDGRSCKGLKFEEVVGLVRGPVGKNVRLTLRRSGRETPLSVDVKRKKIEFPFIEWKMIEQGIGYLKLLQFDRDCDEKFEEGMKQLLSDGMKVLVLDLRGNSGGLLPNCVNICDLFISKGKIVTIQGRNEAENKVFRATRKRTVPSDLSIFCLADARSASASEILIGFLKDYKRATVIGTQTFGKGAVNRIYRLPDDSAIMLTVAHYETPAGTKIGEDGIAPDIVVGEVPDWDGGKTMKAEEWVELVKKAADEQYETAVQMAKEALTQLKGEEDRDDE